MRIARRLLLAAALLALATRRGLAAAPAGRGADADGSLAARLEAIAPRPRASARAVARAFLARRPEEGGRDAAAARVIASLRARAAAGPDGEADMRRALRDAIRADFASGRTASVDGWLLSLTEARLCVAVS